MWWTLAVFLTFPFWMTALWSFGDVAMVGGLAFWLAHGMAALHFFRCPNCGTSPFVSRKGFFAYSTPWPRRKCGECGRDLTVV